ncbi:MAG: type VI secretion system baseplate subunit TssF [Bilophila wadsworthia]
MHAFEDIAGLYREELRSLREDAVRFAVRNPGMARQLGLASDTQPDPLVNLLLESFAGLAARVRADAESRLPLVSHSRSGCLSAVRLPDSVRGRGGIHPQSGGRGRAAGRIRHSGAHPDPQP